MRAMALKIYNTLTRKKEIFETVTPGRVLIYVCGPTVYSKAHVGHAMSVIVFDVIRRYLEYRGYTVQHVMNYTDVDDKIIQRATVEGVDPLVIAERHIAEFGRHLDELNVLTPTLTPRATREISEMIRMIEELIGEDYAYVSDGDVFFDVARFEGYGKLSGRRLDEMEPGARVEVNRQKRSPLDFALWKSARADEIGWDSPWGRGRPGWHIECSAMSARYLGNEIDIHGGGNDLVFPHHENEIAQTEALTRRKFARYWVHN